MKAERFKMKCPRCQQLFMPSGRQKRCVTCIGELRLETSRRCNRERYERMKSAEALLATRDAELAEFRRRCSGENCMGWKLDEQVNWVREERLEAANAEIARLRAALEQIATESRIDDQAVARAALDGEEPR